MKNILLISSIYPKPTDNVGTKVCHFFAIEWVKMGYNVQAVSVQAVYPRLLYWIAKLNRKKIAAKTGAVVYTECDKGGCYEMDGVPVLRIPVFKPIPHGAFANGSVKKAVNAIVAQNAQRSFVPDLILAHFPNPQIKMLAMLKTIYPEAKNALIMHGDIGLTKRVYGSRLPELMRSIDIWGFRNNDDQRAFESEIGKVEKTFMCYSGVPESYITEENRHDFTHPLKNFIYVGEMIERKYPSRVMDALVKVYPEGGWHLNYVGDGQQLGVIRSKVAAGSLEENVSILGRIPRDEIKAQYDAADCFVMISCGEAYGLVYLEAMARGCITIASRYEGFDGVIEDGVNGFLCKAGDANELAQIIARINAMSAEDRQFISDRALETAKRLTDYKAAKMYVEDVIRRI